MTTQALVQSKAAKGFRIAARNLGATASQYRPSGLTAPTRTLHATISAAFDTGAAFGFKSPLIQDKPRVFGLLDTTDITAGDILVCGDTYFVARFDPFRPPLCILCNRTVTLSGSAGAGSTDTASGECTLAGYQTDYGTPSGSSGVLASGWPCSILLSGRGENTDSGVAGALKAADYEMLLPVMPSFVPEVYMTAEDDLGRVFVIEAVEPSQFGNRCRMKAQQV